MGNQRISEPAGRCLSYGFAVLAIFHTVLYMPVYWRLVQAWQTMPQCSHGWFILPLVAWLCFQKRRYLQGCLYSMSYSGCMLTGAGLFLYLAAMVYESDSFVYLSYMISLTGITVSMFGYAALRILRVPCLFLLFMFPLPDYLYLRLTGPLKLFASNLSAQIISSAGIPVLQEGNIIQLPNLQLNVVEACSGIQSLISYIMIGCLLAYLLAGPVWKKAVLVAATVPVALVNNILRITVTGILGEFLGKPANSGFYHELLGLVIFVVGFLALAGVYLLLARLDRRPYLFSGAAKALNMGEKCL